MPSMRAVVPGVAESGEVKIERRPGAGGAVDDHGSVRLPGDARYDRQPEADAALGRQERQENPAHDLRLQAAAVVSDPQSQILASRDRAPGVGQSFAEPDRLDRHLDPAADGNR